LTVYRITDAPRLFLESAQCVRLQAGLQKFAPDAQVRTCTSGAGIGKGQEARRFGQRAGHGLKPDDRPCEDRGVLSGVERRL
jgi:hypothetical protein